MSRRVFMIVLDSLGIGALPDAAAYGDEGSHTVKSLLTSSKCSIPTLQKLGLFNIEGIECGEAVSAPAAAYARMRERSAGKDTTTGHWEMAGLISTRPFPTYPQGFPPEVIDAFEKATGRKTLCNLPYSGTEVIRDYGEEHLRTGNLIVYTSADSVFQIAAHERIVPLEQLYEYCHIARDLLQGEHAVGRVIARPFSGEYPDFRRIAGRHDYSLAPPALTLPRLLQEAGLDSIGVGKIEDIFAGDGIARSFPTVDNADGMEKTSALLQEDFNGLCFVNLVDFDSVYGHRNDVDGYAAALTRFDSWLADFLPQMREGDVLILTADHGCDPITPSTDHSREHVPLLIYGSDICPRDLGTLPTFADVAATVADIFGLKAFPDGTSHWKEITA